MRHRDYPPLSSARTTLVVSLLLAFEGTAAAGAPSRVADLDPNGKFLSSCGISAAATGMHRLSIYQAAVLACVRCTWTGCLA